MNHQLESPITDACFIVSGDTLPLDHGYALFSVLSKQMPQLRTQPNWGLHTIAGRQSAPGILNLGRGSTLRIRLPAHELGKLFPLVGANFQIGNHKIRLGGISIEPLTPVASLWAKFVTIRGYLEPNSFYEKLQEQLRDLPGLEQNLSDIELLVVHRRVMHIKSKVVVGFRIEAHGLTAQTSLCLQQHGLGGRRHMGGGLFIPQRRRP